MEYISKHSDWVLDEKEYFEGSKSGYKTAVSDRDTLQEAMKDAKKQEYDILVAYKDDTPLSCSSNSIMRMDFTNF